MARPVSAIESHPQRQRIIDAILAGRTLREIAAWTQPPVTTTAICRWRQRSTATLLAATDAAKAAIANKDTGLGDAAMQAATRAALSAAIDPFISRVTQLDGERARIKGLAEADGDLRTWVAADRNDLSALELHARLAGRLDAAAPTTNIMIVCPAGAPEPSVTLEPDAVVIDIGAKR